jgi:SAM-dependent methyltransferase
MSKISAHRRAYGQFFTPEPVVACCYALLAGQLPPNPRIADPSCGDGAFLRYAAARGLARPSDLYGCDLDAALVGELISSGLPNVRRADGLDTAGFPAASFDLVIGNPPFGVATSPGDWRSPASEVLFLLRAIELARPGGHIALVLPSGVLANERLQAVRADLIRRCTLLAVVALPRSTFRLAGTSAACSILLLQNAPPPTDHHAFFALAQDLADLPSIVAAFHDDRTGTIYRDPTTGDRRQEDREPEIEDGGWRMEDGRLRSSILHPRSFVTHDLRRTTDNGQQTAYWLPQTSALVQRMDAHFWRPDYRLILERLAAGWPLRPLGELLDRQDGLIAGDHVRPSRGEAKGAGLPFEYYQTREFMPAGYNYVALERCDERAYRRLRHTSVRRHDILVSCAGVGGAGKGRVCLVTHRPGPSCTGDVFILRARRPDPIFLFLFLGSRGGRAQLLRLQNGVGTANLSAGELLQVQVPLVPAAAQQTFAARYTPIAAAHDAALAALVRGDAAAFERERARSEALLAELKDKMDEMMMIGVLRL